MPHHTPWKKSRKYGDIYGGRQRRKYSDNVFARLHSIQKPSPADMLPIFRVDNPSKEFFHPLTEEEIRTVLQNLPAGDEGELTHIWLRRPRKKDYLRGEYPFGQFICGSGVRVIVLYAWPSDLTLRYGLNKPFGHGVADLRRFGVNLQRQGRGFISKWSSEAVRKFTLHVLLHEIGHHIDWYERHWSKANRKQTEEFAEQYAFLRTSVGDHVFGELDDID